MDIQNPLKGKNETYKNITMEFQEGGIESIDKYNFIPYTSITRVHLNDLPSTATLNPKTVLLGAIAFIVSLFFFFIVGKWWGILLGIIAFIVALVMMSKALRRENWYALNIEMASGAVYSFCANNENHIKDSYGGLLDAINERGYYRIDLHTGDITISENKGNIIIGGKNHSQKNQEQNEDK